MIVIETEQGSPEWFNERSGAITASMFAEVRKRVNALDDRQAAYVEAVRSGMETKDAAKVAGYKIAPKSDRVERAIAGERIGDYTDTAKNYAFRLAIERISGEALADGQFETYAMRRGHELEPDARRMHAFQEGLDIERVGLVMTDDEHFGASADGFIGPDGGSEYKCFVAPDKLRPILMDGDWDDVMDQAQGCMWITGRTWWHLCLYCPALAPVGRALTIYRADRDDAYIEQMEADLVEFDRLVEEYRASLANPYIQIARAA